MFGVEKRSMCTYYKSGQKNPNVQVSYAAAAARWKRPILSTSIGQFSLRFWFKVQAHQVAVAADRQEITPTPTGSGPRVCGCAI